MPRSGSYAASHPEKGKPIVQSVLGKRQIGETMLKLNVETIGDVAIIECEGKIVRGESAIKLRDVVMSQRDAHTVVIELSEVRALEGRRSRGACIPPAMGVRSQHPIKAVQPIPICA